MVNPIIESMRIKGYRSLADVEIANMRPLTALIGSNGSGKSNIIHFFELLTWALARHLDGFVQIQGGADDQLFDGRTKTPQIQAELNLRSLQGRSDYKFTLTWGHPDRFLFTEEAFRFTGKDEQSLADWQHLGNAHPESKIAEAARSPDFPGVDTDTAQFIVNHLIDCYMYQFHDTSDRSRFKENCDAHDNAYLYAHGGNLAAILLRLQREDIKRYELICRHIGRVLPDFDRFELNDVYGKVALRWKAKRSDKTFGAHLTSDGSLRFFALVILLNLPAEMLPNVILLDEPELGLHPKAIDLIGGMIKSLAVEKQIIVATQSPLLVDSFSLEELAVLDLKDGRTQIRRPDSDEYSHWLDDYTTGDLWRMNMLGGCP